MTAELPVVTTKLSVLSNIKLLKSFGCCASFRPEKCKTLEITTAVLDLSVFHWAQTIQVLKKLKYIYIYIYILRPKYIDIVRTVKRSVSLMLDDEKKQKTDLFKNETYSLFYIEANTKQYRSFSIYITNTSMGVFFH